MNLKQRPYSNISKKDMDKEAQDFFRNIVQRL